jgi:hypothetical protein
MESHTGTAIILGHAMAHELGHLLLGTNSHSSDGLMRAQWNRGDLAEAARGNLLFSAQVTYSVKSSSRLAHIKIHTSPLSAPRAPRVRQQRDPDPDAHELSCDERS